MPNELLEYLNQKLYEEQAENGKLRYSVFKESTLPAIKDALIFAGISGEDLVRYESFINEALNIADGYLKKG